MTTKTEDQWDDRFGPTVDTPDQSTMWQHGDDGLEEIMTSQPEHVWSVIEGDGGSQYLAPGTHVVNVIGYVIATEAITPEEVDEWAEVLWMDQEDVVRLAP